MIANIVKPGRSTRGVINYLYGPGRANEHTDPHLVASWDGFAPDPGRSADENAARAQLAKAMDLRVKQAGDRAPDGHVWHCSVRAAPTDRVLTDTEWAAIARRVVSAAGIAPEGDPDGCRWIAVRHADDHIHIVATKVRGDLTPARNWNDYRRVNKELIAIETKLGLFQVERGDHTAAKRPTRAEKEKATRRGHQLTARERLRGHVRAALAGAASEDEFFARLAEEGVRVKMRIAPSGDPIGYSVAIVGDRNADRDPIWFSGAKLAPDLSLPRIRQRLTASNLPHDEGADTAPTPQRGPSYARRNAVTTATQALDLLNSDDEGAAAAQLVGTGELLDALAQTSAAQTRNELQEAARAFERATRSHVHAQRTHYRALRKAARDIIRAGPSLGRGEDGATSAMIIDTLIFLAIAAAHWHAAHSHTQQAAASHQAAQHLRAAYRTAAQTPIAEMRAHGQNLPPHTRARYADTLRAVLPEHADRIQGEPNWPALAATLAEAQRAGHDTTALLHRAVETRELATADSLSDVLIWRLRHNAELPAAATPPRPAKRGVSQLQDAAAIQPPSYNPPPSPTPPGARSGRSR
ncbi:relaxase/mobilization nuclease domain-containing protein [Streptomyces sp. NPDC059396]|uniref:relaxase/mobilization nuclease domain-containing protein n=1 Tax=Streptomyces sp. NPDC059396 TaxID=3346819 RepID=UPI003680CE41